MGGAGVRRPLACTPDGALVAGTSGRLAWVVRASDGVVVHRLHGRSSDVTTVCFSRDGATLFTVGDRAVIAWNLAGGAARFIVERALEHPVAALSPDGARLVVDASKEVVAIDTATGVVTASAPRPFPCVFSPPAFTADGRHLGLSSGTLQELGDDLRVTAELDPERALDLACPLGGSNLLAAVSHRALFLYDLDDRVAIAREQAPGETHALSAQGDVLWALHSDGPQSADWHLTPDDAATLREVARDGTRPPRNSGTCAPAKLRALKIELSQQSAATSIAASRDGRSSRPGAPTCSFGCGTSPARSTPRRRRRSPRRRSVEP